jgi:hypothetical protein
LREKARETDLCSVANKNGAKVTTIVKQKGCIDEKNNVAKKTVDRFKPAAVLACCLFSTLMTNTAQAQSGMAEAYCRSHTSIVQQPIQFRKDGIPISVAEDVADSAFDVNIDL